jgi:hypothetical protein
MGILDTYNNTQFSTTSRPTGRGRFSKYDYTASFADKEWSVSQNGVIIVSDTNNNTSSVNRQLAKDWIENDWKRRKATETADNIPLDPGLADPDYSLPGTDDQQTQEEESEVIPITDDQRFLIIGLVVAAALFGFIKR